MTLNELKHVAASVGCTIEDNQEGGDIRATAKAGYRIEPGLHEFVEVYVCMHPSCYPRDEIRKARKQAMKEMADRLKELGQVEPCDDPQCDWCNGY
jgi:hypothetical protein